MQQRAPVVPSSTKLQQSSANQVKTSALSANFFKTTFSSRNKAVPATSSFTVESVTKIGNSETKPVTRNRPKTVPDSDPSSRHKLKRTVKSAKKPEKSLDPERPFRIKQLTPAPRPPKAAETIKARPNHDLKSPNVVLQIVKKSHAPTKPHVAKEVESVSILPPSLRPKEAKPNLKLTKNINNNDVWAPATEAKIRHNLSTLPIRGPSQGKQESTLKGAPSVSSLDSKHHKVAPARDKSLKIFGSKEKLHKAHKKKDLGNNNAVLEDPELREGEFEDARQDFGSAEELGSVDERGSQEYVSLPVTLNTEHMPGFQEVDLRPRIPSEASLASGIREVDSLRRDLEAAVMERAQLQSKVEELLDKAADADRMRGELDRLKSLQVEQESALERLADENGALRARLRGVAHSPLSDSEKRQLLLAPAPAPRRMHSSAPASIALAHNGEGDSGEPSTPEWDKHSSSSLSEVSVACLQDRILQMEEHHYSTSEELQATLAELADLQSQLADAHADNERLADEKQVLLESLCRQTEKLEDSRTKVDTLQELLLREGVEPETLMSGDADQQLFAVLKLSQEERRHMLTKQEQLEATLNETKAALDEKTKQNDTFADKIRSLEGTLERTEAEKMHWESEAGAARELAAARQHQLSTLSDLLDAAKAKLAERAGAEASTAAEAEEAAAAARRDADAAQARAHALAERLAHAQRQLDRAHSDARKLHDDALVSRNTAKSTISELEFQLEQARQEKSALQAELKAAQDNLQELQIQVQVASEEKLALMTRAGEALAHAADLDRQLQDARTKYTQLQRERERDEAEWKQFQSDLLMTVRVANDFKTEAQRELERLVTENKQARDRIRALEDQIMQLKAMPPRVEEPPAPPPLLSSASLQDIMATAASRRSKGVSRQDSRLSVKSLIESIENAAKAAKQSPATTPVGEWPQVQTTVNAVTTTTTNLKNGLSDPPHAPPTNGIGNNFAKPPNNRNSRPTSATEPASATSGGMGGGGAPAGNIPDEQRALQNMSLQQKAMESFVRRNSHTDISERKDPLNALQVKNGGSKRNALLKWCQQKTLGYSNIDITNFSSSWNDGLALCALLHSYLGEGRVPYSSLTPHDKRTNFSVAFAAAESVGIPTTLNIQDMIQQERPDWQLVMSYVTSIYKHFET